MAELTQESENMLHRKRIDAVLKIIKGYGFSGLSGHSGFSGDNPGSSGFSGQSGFSGHGASGASGSSGLSGFSGQNGGAGASGISGFSGGGGSGDVVGPSSSTNLAIARFDGTTGKLVKNSKSQLTDDGILTIGVPETQLTMGWGKQTLDDPPAITLIRANGTNTDVPIFILPKGKGAFSTNPTLWGDIRGDYVIDMQHSGDSYWTVAKGNYSAILGGSRNRAAGDYSSAEGSHSYATLYGEKVRSSGINTTTSLTQRKELLATKTTTDSTTTELFLDGDLATKRMVLLRNAVWLYEINLVAKTNDLDADENMAIEIKGAISRIYDESTTTLVGTPAYTIYQDVSAWSVVVSADTTNGSLKISVTGENSKTIIWAADIRATEIKLNYSIPFNPS